MGRKQKEKTYIKSIRVNQDMKEYLESIENYNKYLIDLIESENQFKQFLAKKRLNSSLPTLFDNMYDRNE